MNECTNKSKRKKKTMNTEKFEEFISQYPIFEYRILDTKDITIQERVRTICQEECERYDSTWACPPAVGTLQECDGFYIDPTALATGLTAADDTARYAHVLSLGESRCGQKRQAKHEHHK